MPKQKILLQFDTDPNPSSFDAVTAIDSGVEHLLQYGSITPENVSGLVHGAMFTRGGADLKSTAIFFGGSDVERAEAVAAKAKSCFFPGVQVSTMSDPNGSNTTAAAAVLAAKRHVKFQEEKTLILGGTGPVGLRIAQLVASESGDVAIASRSLARAQKACDYLISTSQSDRTAFEPVELPTMESTLAAAKSSSILFSAGAAGICLLNEEWQNATSLKVAIDLNAVPPAGISGIEVIDKAKEVGNTVCYGAIGVGGLKMKIHRRCVQKLFESNDQALDTMTIYEVAKTIE